MWISLFFQFSEHCNKLLRWRQLYLVLSSIMTPISSDSHIANVGIPKGFTADAGETGNTGWLGYPVFFPE